MKLAVLGINYYPELTGIAVYNTELCEYLAKKGHNVQMFTGFPYYPFGTDFSSWNAKKKNRLKLSLTENINGVNIKRVNLYKPKKINTIKRIFHELSFCFMVLARLVSSLEKCDMIVCVMPPLLLGLVAYLTSRVKRTPYVLHIQDLQPDTAVELGMLKKRFLTSPLYALEKFIYQKADYIFTVSEGMQDKIKSKGLAKDKVRLFYDWVDTESLSPISKNNDFARKHNLVDKFVVLHAGNMGQKQDMQSILKAAEKLKLDSSICFLLVGRGSKRILVEDYINKYGLSNALLLDVQPKAILSEMFSSADAALIVQSKKIKNVVMPSKALGPAAVQRPLIIAADDDCEISRLAKKYNFGIVIEPEKPDKLVDAIIKLKENKKLANSMGKNGRSFMIEERKMESIIDEFEKNILKQLVRSTG